MWHERSTDIVKCCNWDEETQLGPWHGANRPINVESDSTRQVLTRALRSLVIMCFVVKEMGMRLLPSVPIQSQIFLYILWKDTHCYWTHVCILPGCRCTFHSLIDYSRVLIAFDVVFVRSVSRAFVERCVGVPYDALLTSFYNESKILECCVSDYND